MVALSQMPTFLAVEQKNFYGELVTPSEVSGENVGVLVTTREEKTAPPKKPRLQKGHFMHYSPLCHIGFKYLFVRTVHMTLSVHCVIFVTLMMLKRRGVVEFSGG